MTGASPVQISASEEHACVVMNNGSLYYWGNNTTTVEGQMTMICQVTFTIRIRANEIWRK